MTETKNAEAAGQAVLACMGAIRAEHIGRAYDILAEALAAERERCAKHIELIAADWRAVGADQKVWASEYLARQIRDLV